MIKGHTRIELTNEENGEVTVVEEDNMITNGFRDMFVPLCGIGTFQGGAPFYPYSEGSGLDQYKQRRSAIDCMLGGVLLFRDKQEEDVNNFLLGGTNEITGRGTTYAYTGADTILGSYNIQESGRQEDGSYKKVWDFSTNQANGIINSISLTTATGGAFGNGSLLKDLTGATLIPNSYPLSNYGVAGLGSSNGHYHPNFNYIKAGMVLSGFYPAGSVCYMDGDRNEIIFIKNAYSIFYDSRTSGTNYFYTTNTLTFIKVRFPLTKIGLFLEPTTLEDYEEVVVSIPDVIMSQCAPTNNNIGWYFDDGYIYFVMKSTQFIHTNETLNVLKIKVADFTTEVMPIVNTTSAVVCLPHYYKDYSGATGMNSSGYNSGCMHITNDYLFFNSVKDGNYAYDSKLYRIDLKDNTKVDVATFDGKPFESCPESERSNPTPHYLTGRVRIGDYIYLSDAYSPDRQTHYVLNSKSNTIRRCITQGSGGVPFMGTLNNGASGGQHSNFTVCSDSHSKVNFMISLQRNGDNVSILPAFIPQTLMTINNLSEPIIKTASSSMKVTYTLSEASEEPPTNTEPVNEP